jgi:hypothetical protein
MNTPAPISDIAARFWDALDYYLGFAFSLFGAPAKIARQLWMSRRDHKQFCEYIRPLEEMVRRLIFLLALDLAPMTQPRGPERKYRPRLGMAANAGAHFDMDKPGTWQVCFKVSAVSMDRRRPAGMLPSRSKKAGEDAGGPYAPKRISSAPSAARFEALLRAIVQRDQRAAALARKLAEDGSRALAFTAPLPKKLAHKTGYNTLAELIPHCAEAFQRHLHRKLDALLPNTS